MCANCSSPTPLHCNNQSAIKIATNSIFCEHIKHNEIESYFKQHHYSNTKAVTLLYTPSQL